MSDIGKAFQAVLSNRSRRETLTFDDFSNPEHLQIALTIMDALPFMIAIFDSDFRYLYVNPHYIAMANPSITDWSRKRIEDCLPPKIVDEALPQIKRAIAGEHVSFHLDLPPIDGVTKTVLVNYARIPTDGPSSIFLMTGQDATELKLAEQRLFMSRKLEVLGQLTGGIAHDFNNNIGVIIANLSLLELEGLDEHASKRVQACRGAADRCTKLTGQLLSFARRQPINPRVLRVATHIEAMQDLIRISVPSNIDIVSIDLAPDARIASDPVQFEGVIMNLILNSRDAMKSGGRITIRTTEGEFQNGKWIPDDQHETSNNGDGETLRAGLRGWTVTGGTDAAERNGKPFVLLEVRDDGEGMTPEVARQAFEPFFTTKIPGAGFGMGLAMVYGFAQQLRGFVELVSEKGHGTSVRLYLPAVQDDLIELSSKSNDPSATANHHNILVVEDNADLATALQEMLELQGHKSYACDTAQAALDLLAATPEIDVVLTDMMLVGKMTGECLREQIRIRHPNIRVIFMSGYQNDATRKLLTESPTIEFLAKPFSHAELMAKLNRS